MYNVHVLDVTHTCIIIYYKRLTASLKKAILLGMTSPIPKDNHRQFFSQVSHKDCLPVEWKTKCGNIKKGNIH